MDGVDVVGHRDDDQALTVPGMNFKLEVVVPPVSDLGRAIAFYESLGLAPRRRQVC